MWLRRPDGRLARDVHPYRAAMPLIMPSRDGASVYFDVDVPAARLLDVLGTWNAAHPELPATPFHLVAWALVETLHRRPEMNRFVAGGRLWDRDGIHLSFAAKAAKLEEKAPLLTLKRRLEPGRPFAEVVQALQGVVHEGRNGKTSRVDAELKLLGCLPVFAQRLLYRAFLLADGWGLVPGAMLRSDPLYTSVFVANLGSIGLDACYHHLYEHGTASIFCVVGKVRDDPAVLPLKFTIDERVADGLYAQRSLGLFKELLEAPEQAVSGSSAAGPAEEAGRVQRSA